MRALRFLCLVILLAFGPASSPALAQSVAAAHAQAAAPAPDARRLRLNTRVFDKVWSEVERRYYDPTLNGLDWSAARTLYRPRAIAAPDERALYEVLTEMLDELDDEHANVASPAAVQRREDNRRPRALLGLTMRRQEDARWRVETVRSGSPAEEAGLLLGWYIDTVDGVPWGPEVQTHDGVPVQVRLIDEHGAVHEMFVTPRVLPPAEDFRAYWASPSVMVLDVEGFEPGLGRWAGAQLETLPPGADVVLDLRGNGGGRMAEAENLLSCFLPEGLDWAVQTPRNGRAVTMTLQSGCGSLNRPVEADLIVLVNDGSRSAAELTPAVLAEQGRARIMGEATPGAVLISQATRLPDGGELNLSRQNFVTGGGVRLEKVGVTPHVVVPHTLEDRRAGRDPVLAAAVEALAAD